MDLKQVLGVAEFQDKKFGAFAITTIYRVWNIDGHHVFLVSTTRFANWWDMLLYRAHGHVANLFGCDNDLGEALGERTAIYMMCECSFFEDLDESECSAQARARDHVVRESRDRYGNAWREMELKEAVLDIFARTRNKEWFGEHWPGIVYVQNVAEILGVDVARVWAACDELFVEERLDLNGAILIEYESRFRFPREIQALLQYMLEEPLGWPNGDAGDFFLWDLEHAIHEHTDYKHGKRAFWEHNYPNVSTHILLMFGSLWIRTALARPDLVGEWEDEEYKASHMRYLRSIADNLEACARVLRDRCSLEDDTTGE